MIDKLYRLVCISSTIKGEILPTLKILSQEITNVYELELHGPTRVVKGTANLPVALLSHCHLSPSLEPSSVSGGLWDIYLGV